MNINYMRSIVELLESLLVSYRYHAARNTVRESNRIERDIEIAIAGLAGSIHSYSRRCAPSFVSEYPNVSVIAESIGKGDTGHEACHRYFNRFRFGTGT